MAKVYILNKNEHNYSMAQVFGELQYVTEGVVHIFKTDVIIEELKEALVDFTEEDILLISGPALLGVLATAMLFKRFDSVKLLIFEAKKQGYVLRQINKSNL